MSDSFGGDRKTTKTQATMFDDPADSRVFVWIPGNVPSLKNSKRIITIPVEKGSSKRRPMLVPSKTHEKYCKQTFIHWICNKQRFRRAVLGLGKPLRIDFLFVRGSRHRFDYTNALDTIQDLMVEHGWIPDDNADELLPGLKPYRYDKAKPGVLISVKPEVNPIPTPCSDGDHRGERDNHNNFCPKCGKDLRGLPLYEFLPETQ